MSSSVLSSPRSRSWVRRILRRFRNRPCTCGLQAFCGSPRFCRKLDRHGILRRFRRNGTRPAGGWVTPHAAVNLLPGHGASTSMKERGTRTPATGISGAFSFYSEPGAVSVAWFDPTRPPRVNSSTAYGSYGCATDTRGANGVPLGGADFTNRGGGDA